VVNTDKFSVYTVATQDVKSNEEQEDEQLLLSPMLKNVALRSVES